MTSNETDEGAAAPPGAAVVIGPGIRATGRALCPGHGRGTVLSLDLPLSFWGGVDHLGRVVDAHHPQRGAEIVGTVLVMPSGRGSSSSSSVLAELIRTGHAPAAIVLAEADAIITLGTLAAAELYDVRCPVVQVARATLASLATGADVTVAAG